MDIGFIVASCSWLRRTGSFSRAGRGAQALKVLVERLSQRSLCAHTDGRVSLKRRARKREGDGEGWAVAERES